jgi:predicted transcriptional regulator
LSPAHSQRAAPRAQPLFKRSLERNQKANENLILTIIAASPKHSMSSIAREAGFDKSKVQRIIGDLKEDKLLVAHRNGKCKLTKKGEKEIGITSSDDDE